MVYLSGFDTEQTINRTKYCTYVHKLIYILSKKYFLLEMCRKCGVEMERRELWLRAVAEKK